MPAFTTTVQSFDSLLGVDATIADLNAQTFVLNSFGPEQEGTFQDDDGVLETNDTGETTFNGDPVTFIGSGTAQFGAAVDGGGGLLGGIGDLLGGVTDAVFDLVSDPAPVTVFSAGGEVFVQFPEGQPESILGLDSVLIRFDLTEEGAMIPCFMAGTLIRTPEGDIPIEELSAGDTVLDEFGGAHEILWTGARRVFFPDHPASSMARHRPVRVPRGTFGDAMPYIDLYLSPQHRIAITDPRLALVQDGCRGLVAATHLAGDVIHVDRRVDQITYHHILCRNHVVLVANGLPCESLYLGDCLLRDGLDDRTRAEFEDLFPELQGESRPEMLTALPVLHPSEVLAAGVKP